MEKGPSQRDPKAPFSALAFKNCNNDPFVGTLTYFRVYSGSLNSGDTVYNSVKMKKNKVGRLLLMHANSRRRLKQFMQEVLLRLSV